MAVVGYCLLAITVAGGPHNAIGEWDATGAWHNERFYEVSTSYTLQCGHRRPIRTHSRGEATGFTEVPSRQPWTTHNENGPIRTWQAFTRTLADFNIHIQYLYVTQFTSKTIAEERRYPGTDSLSASSTVAVQYHPTHGSKNIIIKQE